MKTEIKVPTVGESITEATIGSWVKKSGDFVKRNDILLLLETDKASVEVVAENDGILTTQAAEGSVVKIGSTVAILDTDGKASASAPASAPAAAPAKASAPAATAAPAQSQPSMNAQTLSPAVNRIVTEKGLDPATVNGTGKDGRLTKGDVLAAQPGGAPAAQPAQAKSAPAPVPFVPVVSKQGDKKLVPMTNIRKKIAEKLVQAQHNAAMLTTFNEVDMTKINELRNKYKDSFKEKYGVSLGFMGLFAKASVQALKAFPAVNAYIQGDQIEFHNYFNLGVAVSTEKGLMVPVIKDIDQMSVAQIEMAIREFALKARDGKIGVDDMMNGTFTITNGGVFGSLMSTPILNAPQSAILGMHKVEDRAVVVATGKGKEIVIRPMMYLALSYDHRMIDGKEAVSFLVKIKEGVEDPERLLLEI